MKDPQGKLTSWTSQISKLQLQVRDPASVKKVENKIKEAT